MGWLEWLSDGRLALFYWVLIHFVWQGFLIGFVGWFGLQLLERFGPQIRYRWLLTLFGLLAICPLLTGLYLEQNGFEANSRTELASEPIAAFQFSPNAGRYLAHVEIIEAQRRREIELAQQQIAKSSGAGFADNNKHMNRTRGSLFFLSQPPSMTTPSQRPESTGVSASANTATNQKDGQLTWSQQVPLRLQRCQPVLLGYWVLGVGFYVCRLFVAGVACQRLRRRKSCVPEEIRQTASRLASRLGMRLREDSVVMSELVKEAVAVGFWRPVILVPVSWLTELPADCLQAILAHELAHIRRFDLLLNLVQRIIESLLFFHPVVWWLSNRIRFERECCCDQLAVSVTGDRVEYVRALATVASLRLMPRELRLVSPFLGGPRMSLLRRVDCLLGNQPSKPTVRHSTLTGFSVLLLVASGIAYSFWGMPGVLSAQDDVENKDSAKEIDDSASDRPDAQRDRDSDRRANRNRNPNRNRNRNANRGGDNQGRMGQNADRRGAADRGSDRADRDMRQRDDRFQDRRPEDPASQDRFRDNRDSRSSDRAPERSRTDQLDRTAPREYDRFEGDFFQGREVPNEPSLDRRPGDMRRPESRSNSRPNSPGDPFAGPNRAQGPDPFGGDDRRYSDNFNEQSDSPFNNDPRRDGAFRAGNWDNQPSDQNRPSDPRRGQYEERRPDTRFNNNTQDPNWRQPYPNQNPSDGSWSQPQRPNSEQRFGPPNNRDNFNENPFGPSRSPNQIAQNSPSRSPEPTRGTSDRDREMLELMRQMHDEIRELRREVEDLRRQVRPEATPRYRERSDGSEYEYRNRNQQPSPNPTNVPQDLAPDYYVPRNQQASPNPTPNDYAPRYQQSPPYPTNSPSPPSSRQPYQPNPIDPRTMVDPGSPYPPSNLNSNLTYPPVDQALTEFDRAKSDGYPTRPNDESPARPNSGQTRPSFDRSQSNFNSPPARPNSELTPPGFDQIPQDGPPTEPNIQPLDQPAGQDPNVTVLESVPLIQELLPQEQAPNSLEETPIEPLQELPLVGRLFSKSSPNDLPAVREEGVTDEVESEGKELPILDDLPLTPIEQEPIKSLPQELPKA